MGRFVISKRFNGDFQFNLKASNGQIILASQGYSTKASCIAGIRKVQESAENYELFEKKISKNDKFYFILKDGNGAVLGSSEMYETSSARDNGIESVRYNAPTANIDDFTQ